MPIVTQQHHCLVCLYGLGILPVEEEKHLFNYGWIQMNWCLFGIFGRSSGLYINRNYNNVRLNALNISLLLHPAEQQGAALLKHKLEKIDIHHLLQKKY